jgi:hypothetical protein
MFSAPVRCFGPESGPGAVFSGQYYDKTRRQTMNTSLTQSQLAFINTSRRQIHKAVTAAAGNVPGDQSWW